MPFKSLRNIIALQVLGGVARDRNVVVIDDELTEKKPGKSETASTRKL
jgi:hypothetical protein